MLSTPDMINSAFEFFGAPFIMLSIFKLYKEKKVRGISYIHVLFFTTWGFWNLYYYPYLGQWSSFVGGLILVLVNFVWTVQIAYYIFCERSKRKC